MKIFANPKLLLALFIFATPFFCLAQKNKNICVIAYYDGDDKRIDAYPVEKLTHIIYSFCHLKGNRLNVDNARDTVTIKHLVGLKKRNPSLKVILSLGGWGGCKECSAVFNTEEGRTEFAQSTKEVNDYFGTDGIDLDWEYPAIEGHPGHQYLPEDKPSFTKLVQALRSSLGPKHEISFAAGGFTKFLQESIEWDKVMPLIDKVNLMTYDLVNGYTTVTGHHTPLYSSPQQVESTDHCVTILESMGVPKNKLVVGAAMYARVYQANDTVNNGLYRPGKFIYGVSYKEFVTKLSPANGFTYHWDEVAQAPFMFNAAKKELASFDDKHSIRLKTQYAIDKGLNGIMFWQLGDDASSDGLTDEIYNTKMGAK
ncbi:glycoside hydrolase family 18 protein [Foetidibacter luteolus]|uniref:glycoside hydrolase family 18 protein n=1 Tax=Foetidibacter luteolus TaxID=2608880 RepID=UPI00129B4605|nr:glycosyl hydrolase family 18 protein [Foetidibacter luteolus]